VKKYLRAAEGLGLAANGPLWASEWLDRAQSTLGQPPVAQPADLHDQDANARPQALDLARRLLLAALPFAKLRACDTSQAPRRSGRAQFAYPALRITEVARGHVRLASGCWPALPGGLATRWVPTQGFRAHYISSSLPTLSWRTIHDSGHDADCHRGVALGSHTRNRVEVLIVPAVASSAVWPRIGRIPSTKCRQELAMMLLSVRQDGSTRPSRTRPWWVV
jgi:hypothetical protein